MYRSGLGTYIGWPVCGGSSQTAATRQYLGLSGYRGLGCGCGCGGSCGCNTGLGYFDTGWDISGWGWMEWGTVGILLYMIMSTVTTTKRTYRSVRRRVRRMRQ